MTVVVIRPEPGCSATVAAAQKLGLPATDHPLFTVQPLPWTVPECAAFDAVLIGSANAVRHAGPQLAGLQGKPVYAVGEATANACGDAGLSPILRGTGDMQDMVESINPQHRNLLRLAGEERTMLQLPPDYMLTERVVYRLVAQPLPLEVAKILSGNALVVLHSSSAARHFSSECSRLGIPRKAIAIAAIAPRVAEAAGSGWAACACAQTPDDAALLALACQMCQTDN